MTLVRPDFAEPPAAPGRTSLNYRPEVLRAPAAVSIVTPCYNTGAILRETARSVMGQSLQQWEWLIANDGSDDAETLQVLAELPSNDPRIRVLNAGANHGPACARNAALSQATADRVFFLDADDQIEPTALEKMAWCLESNPEYGFCKGYTVWFGAETTVSKHGFEPGPAFLRWNLAAISAMVRREVVVEANGFDESLTDGLEDWDFWLRCAARGHWGRTIREPLDWYRRRPSHTQRWGAWNARGETEMRREFRRRYPSLYAGGFPRVAPEQPLPYHGVPELLPFENRLAKEGRRLLLIIPWMAMGGADRFNLDLIGQLKVHGWEVTVATTLPDNYDWYREFARLTQDLFVLTRFLRLTDYPRFLHYLIRSRQTDVALVSNSEMAYRFLPYLRARCPETAFVDLVHMEEEAWNNGGHPRQAVAYQSELDLNLVTSQHVKDWMLGRGASAEQIQICTTNVDTDAFSPDPAAREAVRSELGIPRDMPVVLYAGRLCDQKQPRVFAAVMRQMKERRIRFLCLVAGDGPDRRWLSSFLRRHRLRREVRMLGAVSSERMPSLLTASDVFFLPSRMEGISVAIYEAMAVGVVPVSADVGGQRELVTAECGFLIEHGEGEVTAYTDVLERLLGSADLRSRLGQASRARVLAGFRKEQMGERVVPLLELAQERRRTCPKPSADPRLGTEHAVQAIEHQRVLRAAGSLWKYERAEWVRGRLSRALGSGARRLDALRWRKNGLLRPLHHVKDVIWIAGHRAKMLVRREPVQRLG